MIKNYSWSELSPFFENDKLFVIDSSIEPEVIAEVFKEDTVLYLQEWFENGLLVCPLPEEVQAWSTGQFEFPALIFGSFAFIVVDI